MEQQQGCNRVFK